MRLRFPNWKRFSLRSLFVLMTLCCVVFGTWSVYVDPYRRQMQSLAFVNLLNGKSRPEADDGPRWQRWLVTKLLGDEAFVRIVAVELANQNVTDRDLQSLSGLCFLEYLSLNNTEITDDSLATLGSLPKLTQLSLNYTNVSDRGARYLSALPNLQGLTLTGIQISDNAVDDLARLKHLKSMYIRWTHISNAGAERLRKELPDCEIFHYSLVDDIATGQSK